MPGASARRQNGAHTVALLTGYGVSLTVDHGALVLRDGIANQRRQNRLHRGQRTLKRIVVLSATGNLSLAALRWCADVGIAVTCIDPTTEEVLLVCAPQAHDDARIRRAQALAGDTPLGLNLAKELIIAKVRGQQANLLQVLDNHDAAHGLDRILQQLTEVQTPDAIGHLEAIAAQAYFAAWSGVRVTFPTRDHQHLPTDWQRFAQRASAIGRGREARKASDPANALLNYAYRLLEVEATLACQRLGLDPGLGVLHRDRQGRNSLSLDLIEPVRPDVDRWVLELLEGHTFTRDDFVETHEGQVRLTPELAENVTAMMPTWAASIAPHAESVAHALVDQAEGLVRRRTPLTGRPKSSTRRRTTPSSTPAPVPRCVDCGDQMPTRQQKRCANCNKPYVTALAHAHAQRARDSLAKTRATGQDPTTTPEALRKRAASVAANHAAAAAWQAAHPDQTGDPNVYWTQIQPSLKGVSVSQISRQLGVSLASASKMRAGSLLPHVRHWDALRELPTTRSRSTSSDS
jgi:CRISPR-associated endonuclease Cas1